MPRKSSRRTLLKGIGAAGIGGFLAGCTQTGGDGGDGGDGGTATMTETETTTEMDGGDGETATMTETETMTETPSNEDFNVGMVYALGGLGDKSFNDMANRGVRQAESELGISFRNAQPGSPSEFKTFQRRFATSTSPSYELICCIGFLQKEALVANSENYSDQKFMIVDNVVGSSNVASYVFKEHEGSFQVGHLAGLLTTMDLGAEAGQTNTDATNVGFVGGVEAPLIKKFQAGYEAGVKHANSDVDIQSSYVGDFSDPAGGKEAALSMYQNGADIVYHAAGGTGVGVFQAAQEQGRYAIGVDADQSRSEPKFSDVILASMVKRVDTAVFSSIENTVNGEFKSGQVTTLGLERNGVEAVLGQELGSAVPSDVKSALETSRKKIIDGEISVPAEP